jgi:hypothetical protein
MTDVAQMLERQARWQKRRQALTWAEKIRMAERVRDSVVHLRQQPDEGAVLSDDTAPEIEAMQVEAWRAMTPGARLTLVSHASRSLRRLALAGLRARHPGATEIELVQRFAIQTLGPELAQRVYPDIARLLEPAP